MASHEASRRTAEAAACDGHDRGLPSTAFRPLDPTLIVQCFFLIGRRPVACSAIVLRLALREGRPISRARSFFFRAIRVDSPTSPAVACSVRRQLYLHVGRRAPRYVSERTALRGHRVVAAPALVFETATSAPLRVTTHHGHPSATHAFADATMRRRRVRCPPSDSVDGHDGAADAAASRDGGGCALGRVIGGPERLLGRAHIAHLFYPSQYSPTVGLRVQRSSPRFLIFTTQSPAYSPSSPAVRISVETARLVASWRLLEGSLPSFRHFERGVLTDPHPLTFCGPLRSTRQQVRHTVHRVLPCVSSALHSTSTFSSVARVP